jgi:hypothetical protein
MHHSKPSLVAPNKPVRRFPRYPADFRLSVELFRPSGVLSLWGLCSELGEDGISGTLTGQLQLGDVVSMEISVPMIGCALKLRAIVRYCDGLRHGFEFLAIEPGQRDALHRTCVLLANTL